MGSDSVDGYDALYQVGKVVLGKERQDKKKEGWEGREYKLNQSFIPFIIFSIHENSKAGILSCDRSDLCIRERIILIISATYCSVVFKPDVSGREREKYREREREISHTITSFYYSRRRRPKKWVSW